MPERITTQNEDADADDDDEGAWHHRVVWQGDLCVWQVRAPPRPPRPVARRGEVVQFTPASRFRMLKTISTIDWMVADICYFVTITYPDEYFGMGMKLMGQYRHVFWRHLERWAGRRVCGLWRTEWVPRKSGRWMGQLMPHHHLIVFGSPDLDAEVVRGWWASALQWRRYVDVSVKYMVSPRQVGYYVAKYCGKVDHSLLGIASYLNNPTGRQWGLHRRTVLPTHPRYLMTMYNTRLAEDLRLSALDGRPHINEWGGQSFTLLGESGRNVGEHLWGVLIDAPEPPQ